MKVKSLLAAILALALALSALTGVAGAGQPDDPGKSEDAPGQVMKAEHAPEQAQAPAAPAAQGKSASAPAKGKEATTTKSSAKSTQASSKQVVQSLGPGVKPSNSTSKWTTCSTGGGQGTSATCSGSHSTKADASKQYGNGGTAAQIANSRGAPAGTVLTGPGNSQPHKVAFCPRKSNKSGGVDVHAVKSYDAAACAEQQPLSVQVTQEQPAQQPAAQQQGGVLGAQAVVTQPKAKPQARGGVLGEIAAVPSGELPFTGIQLWIVLLAGIGLLAAGLGARKAVR